MLQSSDYEKSRRIFAETISAVKLAQSGDYSGVKSIVERVREKSGDRMADIAKKELWNCINAWVINRYGEIISVKK